MSLPLAMILSQNKLTGENYVDWKRNLDIVLTAENHKMVLIKFCPIEPIEESDKEDKEAYKTWIRSDEIARSYILVNDMEIMGALINEENQVDMVLETLSNSFYTSKLNYSMNKLSYNLT